jgi:hypothetical protein
MTKDTVNNVIKFPLSNEEKKEMFGRNVEFVQVDDAESIEKESLVFAYDVIDHLHDMLHEETGDCIFTDDSYMTLTIFAAEVISTIYLMAHGVDDQPIQQIADDLFGNIDVDNLSDLDYTDQNNNNEKD